MLCLAGTPCRAAPPSKRRSAPDHVASSRAPLAAALRPLVRRQRGSPVVRRRLTLAAASAGAVSGGATEELQDAFERLSGTQVYQVSTQQLVDITSLWGEGERVVLAFGRHMG